VDVPALLKPANKKALIQVLTDHVVAGTFTAAQVEKVKSVKTLEGKRITVTVVKGHVFLNASTKVITPNIEASNGSSTSSTRCLPRRIWSSVDRGCARLSRRVCLTSRYRTVASHETPTMWRGSWRVRAGELNREQGCAAAVAWRRRVRDQSPLG